MILALRVWQTRTRLEAQGRLSLQRRVSVQLLIIFIHSDWRTKSATDESSATGREVQYRFGAQFGAVEHFDTEYFNEKI